MSWLVRHRWPCGFCELAEIEVVLYIAVRRRRAEHAVRCHRRSLTARHPISIIVDDDGRNIDIAPRRVDKVVPADCGAVAVARDDDDLESRASELDARGKRDGAAMRGMERIEVEVADRAAGTADARHHDNIVLIEAELVDRADERTRHRTVAAAGAPNMRQSVLSEVRKKFSH